MKKTKSKPEELLLFHASSAADLLTNKQGQAPLTEKQLATIEDFQKIKENPVSKITEGQMKELNRLTELQKTKELTIKQEATVVSYTKKRDTLIGLSELQQAELDKLLEKQKALASFTVDNLSDTAKALIQKMWMKKKHKFDVPVMTPELLKGLLTEQDIFNLAQEYIPSKSFRLKNTKRFKDEFFSGEPDLVLDADEIVEEAKSSFTLKQFMSESLVEKRKIQVQVYLELTGYKKGRLLHGLVNTPEMIVLKEKNKFYHKLRSDIDDEILDETLQAYYQECSEKIEAMHNFDHISGDQRIKCFDVDYDPEIIKELKRRIPAAREYYNSLTLDSILKK